LSPVNRNYAGVARVVFLDLEDDLIRSEPMSANLGKDAAGNTEGRRAKGFADGEADEAWTCRSRLE